MSEPELIVDIPNEAGWPIKSVDSLCSLISRGTAPVYVEHSEVLAIGQRCVASSGIALDFARPHSHSAMRNVLRPEFGDVLLNSTGTGTIGRTVVFKSPGTFIVDGHVTVMRPRAERADSRWLNSVLRTPALQRHLERFCFAGSTNQVELSRTPLRVSRLPTPHIDDQRAMALVIDTLNTVIQETEAIIVKLKAVKQGLLHDLLTRGIDANGELRPPQAEAPHLYKQSPLGWIPKEWEVGSIASACSGVIDCPHSTPHFQDEGVLVARTMHIKDGLFLESLASYVSERQYRERIARLEPQPGDLVFTREAPVGEAFVVPLGMKICLGQRVMLLRPKEGKLEAAYLLAQIYSGSVKDRISTLTSGTTNPHLNVSEVKEFEIPLPPFVEQQVIASRLCELNSRLGFEMREHEKFELMKSGLMDDLLTGRVRVTPLLAEAAQQDGSA